MREVVCLNNKWAFSKKAAEVPKRVPLFWEKVNLPHSWNAKDGQDGGGDYHRGTCYYVKELAKKDLPVAGQYYLEICGANSSADVYVNGKKLAHHDGGYSTWRVNITDALSEKNIIANSKTHMTSIAFIKAVLIFFTGFPPCCKAALLKSCFWRQAASRQRRCSLPRVYDRRRRSSWQPVPR